MQQTKGNKATAEFMQTLSRIGPNGKKIVEKYEDLYGVAQQFKNISAREQEAREQGLSVQVSNLGNNSAYTLTKTEKEGEQQKTRRFYNKTKTLRLDDVPDMIDEKRGLYKEVYMPLIASALGIEQLPLSVRADISTKTTEFLGQKRRYQGTMNEIIEGRDLGAILGSRDISAIDNIDPKQLQKLMVFDMLFENQDAHYKQYILSNNNQLYKIDNEDYMMEEMNKEAKAGSFLAGLPIANRKMTDSVIDMIIGWKPEQLKELMTNAAFNVRVGDQKERHGVFNEKQIERVLSNLNDLKELADEARISGLSARELYELYNSRDESGKMTANLLPKPAQMRPAEFSNKFGTRIFNDRVNYSRLDDREKTEADKLTASREGQALDLSSVKKRMDLYYNLPQKAQTYREMRMLRRQVMTPRLEQERLEQFRRRLQQQQE